MAYKNTRPTSPKGKVYIAFETEGDVRAMIIGHQLGLPDSKVKRWLQQWANIPSAAASSRVRIRKPGEWVPAVHDRVYLALDKDQDLGTVTAAGSEQSWVKWDVGYGQSEINGHLRQAERHRRRA